MQFDLFNDIGFNAPRSSARAPEASIASRTYRPKPTDVIKRLGATAKGTGLCGIYAVAYAAGRPVNEVFEDFRRTFKKRGNWKGSTRVPQIEEMLKKYGVKCKDIDYEYKTLNRFVLEYTNPNKTYLVITTGHVQIIKGGTVTDQCRTEQPIAEYRLKRKCVRSVKELV